MFLFLLWLLVIFVLSVNGLTTAMWVCIAIPVAFYLLFLLDRLSGKSSRMAERSYWRTRIDHPHYITDDEYECSTCGRRFSHPRDFCPYCGIRFCNRIKDSAEYYYELDEELEMDEWDEEE